MSDGRSTPAVAPADVVVDEVYGFIKILSDGSVVRPPFPGGYTPASASPTLGVSSRDITIHQHSPHLSARFFLPQSLPSSPRRFPIVLHFHPGGLCTGSPSASAFHRFCSRMSVLSQSIWISVDYRLAPEHRLPAAYDDAFTALTWLRSQALYISHLAHADDDAARCHDQNSVSPVDPSQIQSSIENSHPAHVGEGCHGASYGEQKKGFSSVDPWLYEYADFSNCFLAGESSGGAIVHYLTMRIAGKDLAPLHVRGLLIIHAAFLIKGMLDTELNPKIERRPGTFRRLMLPEGAPLDHPLVDPLHPEAPSLMHIKFPPALVAVADKDQLCPAASHYARVLKQYGHDVQLHQTQLQGHCFYLINPQLQESKLLFHRLAAFIRAHCLPQQGHSSL